MKFATNSAFLAYVIHPESSFPFLPQLTNKHLLFLLPNFSYCSVIDNLQSTARCQFMNGKSDVCSYLINCSVRRGPVYAYIDMPEIRVIIEIVRDSKLKLGKKFVNDETCYKRVESVRLC